MATTTISRVIKAPAATVFETVADAENFAAAVPHLVDVEFVGDQRRGVGTRFRETRVLRGRQATTELEVTEYVPNEQVRLIADEGGTIWDTTFAILKDGDASTLQLTMEATPYQLAAKVLNPLMKGLISRAIEGDMDAVKAYCERQARERSAG